MFPLYSTKYSNETPKVQSKENSGSGGKLWCWREKYENKSGTLLFQRFTVRQFICETLFNRTLARTDKLQQYTHIHTYSHPTCTDTPSLSSSLIRSAHILRAGVCPSSNLSRFRSSDVQWLGISNMA